MASPFTRRGLLSAGLLGGVTVLAGCLGRAENPSPQPTDSLSHSVIRDVGFESGEMVIEFRDDHTVSQLNLIGPDGSTARQASVPSGETTSHLEILDIRPGLGGYEHYEPGEYELVAVQANGSSTLDLELEPHLRITDVQQYRDGERNADYGKLAVTVENVGTGPTWVYDIAFEDAPNPAADSDIVSDPGVPQLDVPKDLLEAVLDPQEERTFVGVTTPFLFTRDGPNVCTGNLRVKVLVGLPVGDILSKEVSASIDGDRQSVGLIGQYTCTNISIEVEDGRK